jgi:acyl-CoA synthetase (AMP-forming)/AMP-acid ligase II
LEIADCGLKKKEGIQEQNVFSAAAPIPVPVLKRAIELMCPVFSIQYGCTELGSICALPRRFRARLMHSFSPIEFWQAALWNWPTSAGGQA